MFVKICGTTSEEDALLAVAMGADAVGFVFAPSARRVAVSTAADIVKRLPREIITVGVFRDDTPERVIEVCSRAGLRAAQLHGHESPEDAQKVRTRVPLVIKAFAAGDPGVVGARGYGAQVVLIDAPRPGSGQVFDWSMAEAPDGMPLLLAGGLNTANVAEAIARVHPWGVDVATGVEASPGRKDPVKMKDFVAAVRAAAATYAAPEPEGDEPFDWEWDS